MRSELEQVRAGAVFGTGLNPSSVRAGPLSGVVGAGPGDRARV